MPIERGETFDFAIGRDELSFVRNSFALGVAVGIIILFVAIPADFSPARHS